MPRRDGSRPLDDRVRMQHMLDAARQAVSFIDGRERPHLDSDPMLRRALKDCIQEIGEAAARITEPSRARAPDLPWKQVVGMRHRIVHVYYDIDCNALWEVAVRDLPVLIDALSGAIDAWDAPRSSDDAR
ncbi:MAG: DUF86 domain-containing protein [Phycisphaerales bacterium]|nr:DUF86 domain-containing protein [Phycisphaerales bacterium]